MEIKQISFSRIKAFKTKVFSSYYNLIESQFSMSLFYLVFITIEYLQNINLIQFNLAFTKSKDNLSQEYSDISSSLIKVNTLIRFYPTSWYNLFKGLAAFLMSFFILFFIFMLSFKKMDIKKPKPVYQTVIFSFLLLCQIISMSFLTTPIFITLLSFYQCTNESMTNYPEIPCYAQEYYIIISISSIGLFCFVVINLLNAFLLIDHNPSSKLPFSSVFSSNTLLRQVFKLVLSLFYIITPLNAVIKVYVVFAISLAKFFYRFFEMTFFNRTMGWFLMAFDTGELFFSVMAIFHHHSLFTITLQNEVLEIAVSVILGVGMNLVYYKIQYYALTTPSELIITKIGFLMKVFALFNYAKEFKTSDYKRNMFMSVLHYHRLHCLDENCQCEMYAKVLNKKHAESLKKTGSFIDIKDKRREIVLDGEMEVSEVEYVNLEETSLTKLTQGQSTQIYLSAKNCSVEIEKSKMKQQCMINTTRSAVDLSEHDCIYGFIKLKLDQILSKVPSTVLTIFFSYLLKDYLKNYFKGLFEMMKLNKKTHSISEQFAIFCVRARIENQIYTEYKNNINEDLSIELVLEYNEITNQIIDYMKYISKEMCQFWSIITLAKCPSQSLKSHKGMVPVYGKSLECPNIYTCAINASKNNEELKKSYDRMLNTKHFINKKVLYIYIIYLEKVAVSMEEVRKIKSKMKVYEGEHNLIFEQLSHQNAEIYRLFRTMDKVGIIIISGDIINLGKILSVNHQLCSIYKYSKDELNKDTVNKLMPSFIGQYHDEFMHRFLETSNSHILEKLRILFGLSKEGLIIPTYLYVKLIPDLTNSVRFIGILKPLRKDHPFLRPDIHNLPGNFEEVSKACCLLLVSQKGEVFGVNKSSLKYFGIPLTLLHLSNEKAETPISLQALFPSVNFDEDEVKTQLRSQAGKILKLDSRSICHLFDDYKESITDSNLQIKKTVEKIDIDTVFKEHFVLAFSYQLQFNEGQVHVQILKLIPLRERIISDSLIFTRLDLGLGEFSQSRLNPMMRKVTRLHFSSVITTRFNQSNKEEDQKKKRDDLSDDVVVKRRTYLNEMKLKLTSYAIPFSIKIFAVMILVYLTLFLIFGLSGYFISIKLSQLILSFIGNYLKTMERNFYFSLTVMNFRLVTLFDNGIINPPDLQRERIVSIINENIQILVYLNNQMFPYMNYLVLRYQSHFGLNEVVDSWNLDSKFSIFLSKDRIFFIIDQILVKMKELVALDSLLLPNKADLFYYNTHLAKSAEADVVRDIFYVLENYFNVIRYEMDRSMELFHYVAFNSNQYIDLNPMVFIFIPSFCFVVSGVILFYFVLKRIADYKVNIMKIFYFMERNYGLEAMKKCADFIEFIEKFVSSTDSYNEFIEKEREIPTTTVKVTEKKNLLTPNYADNYLMSEANRLNPTDTDRRDESRHPPSQWIPFWRLEKNDEDMANSITDKQNSILQQLNKSKQIFWRHLCIIYLVSLFLFVVSVIYNSINIALNFEFQEQWNTLADPIHMFGIRGWSFINLLMMSRQMIFRDSTTSAMNGIDYSKALYLNYNNLSSFDYYSLYLNQTDRIENYILLLSNQRELGSFNDLIDAVCQKELDLNSEGYCLVLEQFDSVYYNAYIKDSCQAFYANNLGIKDNIKIIYAQLKNNFPVFDANDLASMEKCLKSNFNLVINTGLYISQAILSEITTLMNSVISYGDNYQRDCVIQILFYSVFLAVESVVWIYIILYLIKVLNKDKLILTLVPFESIMLTKKALNILKQMEKN